jgi:hypothetical protein
MKLTFASLAILTTIGISVRAQSVDTTQSTRKLPPAQRSVRQLQTLQQKLDLSQDQVIKLNTILLSENIALDSLSQHPSGDRRTDNMNRRDILHAADVRIYSLLNENQQAQYVLWKQEQRIRNLEKRQAALTGDSTHAQAPPQRQQ